MTDNDKNKKTSDGWDPTEYEIYLSDEEEKEEEPQTSDAPVAEDLPEKKPHKKKNKKAVKAAVAVILAVVILLALVAAAFHFLSDRNTQTPNNNEPQTTSNTVRITFPEGYTVYQMGQLLEQNGVCTAEAFYTAANTPVESIEITNADERAFLLEGYLFPDTYDFYLNESADSVIKRFTDNFNAKITDEYIKKQNRSATRLTKYSRLRQSFKKSVTLTLMNVKMFLRFFITDSRHLKALTSAVM